MKKENVVEEVAETISKADNKTKDPSTITGTYYELSKETIKALSKDWKLAIKNPEFEGILFGNESSTDKGLGEGIPIVGWWYSGGAISVNVVRD
ncbi:MAG: hypothetical protein KAJ44_00800 [Thermoplasmatales archaeon]|nr:hypothetical protein [Thermoplasmatales archaeon]